MRLVVDASTLVAESLRISGQELLEHPDLDIFVTERVMDEARHELAKRRVILRQRGGYDEARLAVVFSRVEVIFASLRVVPLADYAAWLPEAAWRIPRDPDDAPTVALALALGCGVWTGDRDFCGGGLPVWATDVLRRYLDERPEGERAGGDVAG